MAVRRNNQPSTPSADPFSNTKAKGSLIWATSRFISDLFSHRGAFWLGAVVALVCFIANIRFYHGMLLDVMDWGFWVSLGAAFLVSFGTSLFETLPVALKRSPRLALNQIFAAGAKPQDLPELNPSVVGDADELLENYRSGDRETLNFFKKARWIAIGLEVFLGVVFMGSVGVGLGGLISLILFGVSIFGCEWGVSLALRASRWELPPQVREQLDELIANSGKALKLRRF